MTNQEKRIIDMLETVYEEYIDLNVQHKDDQNEFINALHILQHLVMIRSVRRKHPNLFPVNVNLPPIINNDDKPIIIGDPDLLNQLFSAEVKIQNLGENE